MNYNFSVFQVFYNLHYTSLQLKIIVAVIFLNVIGIYGQDPLTNYEWSSADENSYSEVVNGLDPFGNSNTNLLEITPDGNWRGYEFNNISINPNSTYRFSFWAKATYDTPSYSFAGKVETNNGLIKPDNTQTSDKYIQTGWAIPGPDNWYLYVGFIKGNSDSGTYTGAIYSTSSLVGNDGGNGYRFESNTFNLNFSAAFNSADPSNKIYLYGFNIKAVTNDSVDDLLNISGTPNSSKINLLGLNAEQSTNNYWAESGASIAIDGNLSGDGQEFVTHTKNEENSWWRLDLGAEYDLTRIDIHNRTDCCNGRLIGTKVYVGSIDSYTPSDYQEVGGPLTNSLLMQQINFNATGRFILVSQHDIVGDRILSIAELEAYGTLSNSGTGDNNSGNNNGGGDSTPPNTGESVWTTSGNDISYNQGNVDISGQLAIGTTNVPSGFKLAIDGKLITEEVRVELSGDWPDYVFTKEYDLTSLEEIKKYIQEKGHLPKIPSAKEIENQGIELGEMNKLLLEKIEELTLHLIQLREEIDQLKNN